MICIIHIKDFAVQNNIIIDEIFIDPVSWFYGFLHVADGLLLISGSFNLSCSSDESSSSVVKELTYL